MASEQRTSPGSASEAVAAPAVLAPYTWAAAVAAGREVLDAGCGLGDGAAVLAAAGAARVVGVDPARAALDAAGEALPDRVELVEAGLAALPFDDDAFDLVTCFDTLEHEARPDAVLAELARVVRAGGLLLCSGGEPTRAWLGERFAHVAGAGRFAAASDGEAPEPPPATVLASDEAQRRLAARWEEQRAAAAASRRREQEADAARDEIAALRRELAKAEGELARLPEVEADRDALRLELEASERRVEELRPFADEVLELRAARQALEDIKGSASWRLTRPLRRLMRALR